MRKLLAARGTSVADVVGVALVSTGVGAYSWPAGLIAAGAAVLAASWVAAGRKKPER